MKITLVTPDVSNNCLGRIYILAEMLSEFYDIEIIGAQFGDSIWPPLKHSKIPIKSYLTTGSTFNLKKDFKRFASLVTGDVILSGKTAYTSYIFSKKISRLEKKPIVIDIDDWDLGFIINDYRKLKTPLKIFKFFRDIFYVTRPDSILGNYLAEHKAKKEKFMIVSNRKLKEKFGGQIICHARDTEKLNPSNYNSTELKIQYHLPLDKKIIMFFGTLRRHKGLEVLIESLNKMQQEKLPFHFVLAGSNNSKYDLEIFSKIKNKLARENYTVLPQQPFEKLPELISLCDIYVIPQKKEVPAAYQIPAKIFDAMSMEKIIIASKVSEMDEILNDCGYVYQPDDPQSLYEKIKQVYDNPQEAKKRAKLARKRCLKKYSYLANKLKLKKIIDVSINK